MQSDDPVFQQEQEHLTATYATLRSMGRAIAEKMRKTALDAADTKQAMSEELSIDLSTDDDAMETYADFESMNRIIEAYNISQDVSAEKLASIRVLLEQPYFAKVVLGLKPGQPPKELYIGTAGVSDDAYRRMVVDWRSPVAEVYYNQDMGPTSYQANGRTINVDLQLRRQFDIHRDVLNAYFDTNVAIEDSLLLASLSKQRTAQMQAITATIQKEQNQVIRYDDVPALLVSGIAGSGKTSVLLQRIAYLFYQQRGSLDPSQVFLITPNPVFRTYIANVLPDLGERNPETITWAEFADRCMPAGRTRTGASCPPSLLERIDEAVASPAFAFDPGDFKDITCEGQTLVTANQVRQVAAKFGRIAPGPHLVTLMREELETRLENRLASMAASDATHDMLSSLSVNEQLAAFGETFDPQDEAEARTLALSWLRDRYAGAFHMVRADEWLRIDRVGMRILGVENLSPEAWLYLKCAVCGMGNPDARYVVIDEVQDYTAAQLMVLARYFRRANFLMLGDPNQAIKPDTATFDEVRAAFRRLRGGVEECRLMTSYRSTPQITNLFASLLPASEQLRVQSVQREDEPPRIESFDDEAAYAAALREALQAAQGNDGTTAVIVPWKQEAKRLRELAGDAAPTLLDDTSELPSSGVMLTTLALAKGLEFDHVVVPDASERAFGSDDLARRRLYTTVSRATRTVTILANGKLTPLLKS